MELKDKLFLAGIMAVFIAIICAVALGVMIIWNITLGLVLPDMSYTFSFVLTLVAAIGGIWYWLSNDPCDEDPYYSELEHYNYPECDDDEESEGCYNEIIPSDEEDKVVEEKPQEPEKVEEPVVEKPKKKTTRKKKVKEEKEEKVE